MVSSGVGCPNEACWPPPDPSAANIVSLDRFIIRNGNGGGIYSSANLTITNSSIQNNSAVMGGGIYQTFASLTLNNTTISNNSTSKYGGGIFHGGTNLVLNNTTISNNSAGWGGGGIYTSGTPAGSISNSILAGNTDSDCPGITSSGNNIIGNASGCSFGAAGDQLNVDPKLGAFLFEQGYQPLLPGSPAINTGNAATCLPTDQRGAARGGMCDIGAYEYTVPGSAARLIIVSGDGQHAIPSHDFSEPLTVVAGDSQGSPIPNLTVTFIAPEGGASGTFADTGTRITVVTTNASGSATASTFTANDGIGLYPVIVFSSGVEAAYFYLTNRAWFVSPSGNDSNSCATSVSACLTINGAMSKATSGDIIAVAIGTYTGSSNQVVSINKRIALSGGWSQDFSTQSGMSTIDGQNVRRGVYVIYSGMLASIDHFIITHGKVSATYGSGGGVYNNGNLTINNTAIVNNSVSTAALSFGGGGIYNDGKLTLNNTTVSNNTAGAYGGGIFNDDSRLTINNSTITDNSAYMGGGIYTTLIRVIMKNTIMAQNRSGRGGPDCEGVVASLGYNLIGIIGGYDGCSFHATTGDLFGTQAAPINPQLGPFIHGYYTLLANSPAINSGNPATCLATDQRGVTRPQGSACDVGAYEYAAPGTVTSLVILSGSNQRVAPNLALSQSLEIAALDGQGTPVPGVNITFTAPGSGASGTFANTGTTTTSAITDVTGIAVVSTFIANSQLGAYVITASASGTASVAFELQNSALYVAPTGNDTNSCSIDSPCATIGGAINQAATGETIVVATGTYTGSGTEVVLINKSINLSGGWDSSFTTQNGTSFIDGQSSRAGIRLTYGYGVSAIVDHFTTQNSYTGGGVENFGGTLIINHTTIIGNNSGGIENSGTLILNSSTINNNTVDGDIYGSGITNTGILTLNNSTVSGNIGGQAGLYNHSGGALTVNNSTITGNQSSGFGSQNGYGLMNNEGGQVTIQNTIIANNGEVGDCYSYRPIDNYGGSFTSQGYNLIGNNSGCMFTATIGDLVGTSANPINPVLSPLQDNGGFTYTHALGSTSPAIEAGNPATPGTGGSRCLATDQRGVKRPKENYCDIGAYEYWPPQTISGNVGAAGVTLSYVDGTPQTVTSDGNGNYSITVLWGWSGTVTPSLATDAFCPASQNYNNLTTNKTLQNYAHAPCPNLGSISKWTSSFDLSHGWTVKDYVRTVGDVDGDGDTDLVGFGQDGVYVALSNGTSFDAVSKWTSAFDLSHGWTVASYVRTVGDVNGDSKVDLVGFGLDGVYIALSNGTSFDAVSKWTSAFDLSHGWTVKDYVRTVGDVNGDGNADLVGFGLDGVYVALSNGTSFDAVSKWTSAFDLSHGWTVKDYVRTIGDVNGDGNADLVGFGLDGVYVALSNGSGFDAVSKWTSGFALANGWTVKDYIRTVGDVDGDGKADIVGFGQDGVYISLSMGNTFSLPSRRTTSFDLSHGWTVASYVRTMGDVNADGKDDLVGFGLDGVYVVPAQ